MTDIGNLLDGGIPVDLEREVLIYTEIRAHKQDHRSPGPHLSRYSAGKRSTVALLKHSQQNAILKRSLRTNFTQIARITGPRLSTPGKCSVWPSK
jgi:hypothetical protein